MADAVYIGTTQVHPAQTCFGYGTCNVVHLDWGTPDAETFLDAKPLMDGMSFRGRVTKDRKFTMVLAVADCGSWAKGQDVWEDVLDLIGAHQGLIVYRYTRNDGAGGSVDRTLLAQVVGEPAWAWQPEGGGDGLRTNGNLVITLECLAPFPWWRNTSYSESYLTATDTASVGLPIARSGQIPCGVEVKVASTGTLSSMAVSDGVRSMTLTGAFTTVAKGADWFHADPGQIAIDAGVRVSAGGFLSMNTATTTVVATPGGAASGTHTLRVRHYPLWKTP